MMDIRLYQINRERDEEHRALLPTETLARRGSGPKAIDSSIYDCVFEGTVNCSDLEEVYTLFNVDPPENFSGHSMSVSDVVVEGRTAFFCDSIGFRQVTFDESAARPLPGKSKWYCWSPESWQGPPPSTPLWNAIRKSWAG